MCVIHSARVQAGAMSQKDRPSTEVDGLRRENEALRAQLASAETERQRLEALVRTSPVGVLVVDARTRTVKSVNQEAERIMGVPPRPGSKLERYQAVAAYRRPDGREYSIEERPLSRALDQGETVHAEEILLERPGDGRVTTLVSATPIYSKDGEIESAVAVIQDMTPLEEMERLRSEFLGMVSHELRSPLAAIKGSAATVLNTSTPFDDAEMLQFFRIIDRQADRLRDLIGSLLDITRIEAGMLSLTLEPVSLVHLADEARSTFLSGGGRHRVAVDLPMDLPLVAADERRVAQVLSNLLVNASRYSPDSSVIRITASRSADSPHLAVSVSDKGMGVSADLLPHLFKKFSRAWDDGEERRGEGAGLGLAICKGIVEAHGGRIWAESEGAGQGTRFTFTIPVAEVEEETGTAASSAGETAAHAARPRTGKRTRVLAVDDEPQLLRFLRGVLSDAGYSSLGTGDPTEVLPLLETEDPHIVLLDLVLPGTTGFDVLKRIRGVSEVPVIFLSAHDRDEEIVRALSLGADDYIVKPFSPSELLARIEAALRRRAMPGRADNRSPYRAGDLTIDYANRRVELSGQTVHLTATEYTLLAELSANAGRVVTHGQLLERVWGPGYADERELVRAFVTKLRHKLGDDAHEPKYVFTKPGVGYRMAKP